MAISRVPGCGLDRRLLLRHKGHPECRQGRLFHRSLPLRDINSPPGEHPLTHPHHSQGCSTYHSLIFLPVFQIRGVTLEGAADGVLFYIQPEWERLASPQVWADAASQVFYSFGIACSSLVTFASYNHVNKFIVLLPIFLSLLFCPSKRRGQWGNRRWEGSKSCLCD